jgi:hypothetical protein
MNVGEIAFPGVVPIIKFAKLEEAIPVPLRLIIAELFTEELLVMVS